jgi:hypothetical protein
MLMRRFTLAAVVSVVSALCALGARAAVAAPRQELSAAAGIDSAYDGNVYNGRGPDFVNRISPAGKYRLIDPRVTLDVDYLLGYWTYAFGKAENSINQRAAVGIEGRATERLTLKVSNEVSRAEDPGFLLRIGVVAPQIGITDDVAEASMGFNITRRWFGAAGYLFHMATFDAFTPQQVAAGFTPLFDGAQQDANLAFTYRVTRLDDLHFGTRFQHFSAGPQHTSIGTWDLANTYSPTVGWRHQFIRPVDISADVGPLVYQALPGAMNVPTAVRDSGVTYRVGAQLRYFTPTWRASLAYTHDLLGATGAGSALWADYVYGQAGYHYLERLDVNAGVGYFRNGDAINQPFAYDGVTGHVLVDWRVINYLRLGAYYDVRWQETGPGAFPAGMPIAQFPNVTRNIVGVRLLAVVGADAQPPRREVHE